MSVLNIYKISLIFPVSFYFFYIKNNFLKIIKWTTGKIPAVQVSFLLLKGLYFIQHCTIGRLNLLTSSHITFDQVDSDLTTNWYITVVLYTRMHRITNLTPIVVFLRRFSAYFLNFPHFVPSCYKSPVRSVIEFPASLSLPFSRVVSLQFLVSPFSLSDWINFIAVVREIK